MIKPIRIHPFVKSIYWREYQEDKERKKEREKKNRLIRTQELNDFVLGLTKKKIELPDSGNLDEATFLYKNWKLTDVNNTNAKIIGIGEKKGEYKY